MTPTVYLTNHSTQVTEDAARRIALAVDLQLRQHVCPAWGLLPIGLTYSQKPPVGAWAITMQNTLDEPDALAYHTQIGSRILGVAGTEATLKAGNQVLTGAYSVASLVSHEACELVCDLHCSSWSDNGHGLMVATEVCDPVQSDHYDIATPLGVCSVSSFVLPGYFDPQAAPGDKLDYLGRLHRPFTIDKGGYWVQIAEGRSTQKFGMAMPEWLREAKQHPRTRTQRRVRHGERIVAAVVAGEVALEK